MYSPLHQANRKLFRQGQIQGAQVKFLIPIFIAVLSMPPITVDAAQIPAKEKCIAQCHIGIWACGTREACLRKGVLGGTVVEVFDYSSSCNGDRLRWSKYETFRRVTSGSIKSAKRQFSAWCRNPPTRIVPND